MEKAMVGSLRCAWHADFNRFKVTRWAHDFTSSLLALSVLSCILFLLPILLYPCFPPEPSPHSTLLPKIWCLGLFWEAVPMFFFGYTFAGWMHLVVSSVFVDDHCSCCQGLNDTLHFLVWELVETTEKYWFTFFFHLGMYFNKGMDSIMEV